MMPYLQVYAVKPPNRNAIRFISLQRMKQTNNAIKFLMAQYRAIFKKANIAMFAAMAAAALAAGQAQAVDIDAWDTGLSGDMTITADNKLNITVDATKTNTNGFNATITAGDSVIVGKDGTDDIAKMDGQTGNITLNGALRHHCLLAVRARAVL